MDLESLNLDRSEVVVPAGRAKLKGTLTIPPAATALVLFAQGSGSSSRSPRNQFVAQTLIQHGLATLLLDLLTSAEEAVDPHGHQHQMDLSLLGSRLAGALDWVGTNNATRGMPLGLFGSSTGAAVGVMAAANRPAVVKAIVSRGGRPDLAGPFLRTIIAPTLLIVGGRDPAVIVLNEWAREMMPIKPRLEIVPGASHLFVEPGTLEQVARLACRWFRQHLNA